MSDTKQSATRKLCAEVLHHDRWATKKWVADPRSELYILHDGGKKGPDIRVDGSADRNLILCYRTAAPALARIVERVQDFAADLEKQAENLRHGAIAASGGYAIGLARVYEEMAAALSAKLEVEP